jgi:transcriptional regulator with XRE-family HTH domain
LPAVRQPGKTVQQPGTDDQSTMTDGHGRGPKSKVILDDKLLSAAMVAANLTQEDLALRADVDVTTIRRAKKGGVTVESAMAIAAALDVHPYDRLRADFDVAEAVVSPGADQPGLSDLEMAVATALNVHPYNRPLAAAEALEEDAVSHEAEVASDKPPHPLAPGGASVLHLVRQFATPITVMVLIILAGFLLWSSHRSASSAPTKAAAGPSQEPNVLRLTCVDEKKYETSISLEPIREVWIHDEVFVARRLSMMRIMARRTKATTVVT